MLRTSVEEYIKFMRRGSTCSSSRPGTLLATRQYTRSSGCTLTTSSFRHAFCNSGTLQGASRNRMRTSSFFSCKALPAVRTKGTLAQRGVSTKSLQAAKVSVVVSLFVMLESSA